MCISNSGLGFNYTGILINKIKIKKNSSNKFSLQFRGAFADLKF